MKLIVQIPALTEEGTVEATIRAIPRSIPGIATVNILVIDDGRTDTTVETARSAGADPIAHMSGHVGLGR